MSRLSKYFGLKIRVGIEIHLLDFSKKDFFLAVRHLFTSSHKIGKRASRGIFCEFVCSIAILLSYGRSE
jgi:hypothetical protein